MTANSRGPINEEFDGGGERDITETSPDYELPEDMTVAETLAWVSGDKAKALKALEAENKRDHPRAGVIGGLEPLVNDETGAGIGSGEA